jgi:DNA polymerase zeta
VVSRTPFYGYHEEPRPFLHVQMVRPGDVEPAARLFMRGFCQRRPRQPHEAHVPHLLQFKVDYNLLGMDFVRLERVRWRGTLPLDSRALELPPPPPTPPNAAAASGSAPSSSAAANARDAPLPSSAAAGLPSGGAPSSSPAASQPGYRCVWTRGRSHGLDLQVSAADGR